MGKAMGCILTHSCRKVTCRPDWEQGWAAEHKAGVGSMASGTTVASQLEIVVIPVSSKTLRKATWRDTMEQGLQQLPTRK